MVLHAAPSMKALMLNPGNKFHALKGDMKGQFAISINKQWRVSFQWHDEMHLMLKLLIITEVLI